MSQKARRVFTLAALVFALSVVLPAPSQAAGLRGWQPPDLVGRVWSWLADLGLISRHEAKPAGRWEKEGSGINPDGSPKSPTPQPTTNSDQGSMIDPDGRK